MYNFLFCFQQKLLSVRLFLLFVFPLQRRNRRHTQIQPPALHPRLGKMSGIGSVRLQYFYIEKPKSPIYIYMVLCYYVFGEDWELSGYFR